MKIGRKRRRTATSFKPAALIQFRFGVHNRAKMLLLSGQKLAVIAEATGFYDAAHLATTFKRVEGLSPRAYRQGIQRELSQRHRGHQGTPPATSLPSARQ